MRKGPVALLGLVAACSPSLQVPPDAVIVCTSDAACPDGYACDPRDAVCVKVSSNLPPSVTLAPLARSTGVVALGVTLSDPEGDAVDLSVELVDELGVTPLDLGSTDLAASPTGVTHTLSWDALSLFSDAHLRRGLALRVTPRDAHHRGLSVTSDPFDFGNDDPTLGAVVVAAGASTVTGTVAIDLTVSDSSSDTLDVTEVVLSLAGDFSDATTIALDAATFPASTLTSIASDPNGALVRLNWASGIAANTRVAAARLRITVADGYGGLVSIDSEPFAIDNAPIVTAATTPTPPGRYLNEVPIAFFVDDGTGAGESVAVAIEVNLTDPSVESDWHPATAAASSEAAGAITDFGSTQHTFVWDALADVGTVPGLASVLQDTDGDGVGDASFVAYVSSLWLRATPTDSHANVGAPVTFGPTAIGNDVPVTHLVQVDGVVARDVPLAFFLADSALDVADIELEFRMTDPTLDVAWRTMQIVQGRTQRVFSVSLAELDAAGTENVVIWDSFAPRSDVFVDPQGIGDARELNVEVRARARDQADAATTMYGAWSAPMVISEVRNQSPPQVAALVARRAEVGGGTSPVDIYYTLSDEQGDLADVEVEVSFNNDGFWLACPEFPTPYSEGRRHLLTESLDIDGAGGVRHVYVCDPSALTLAQQGLSKVRMRAADAGGVGAYVETVTGHALAPGTSATLFSRTPAGTTLLYGYRAVAATDLDGDGARELVVAQNDKTTVVLSGALDSQGGPDGSFAPWTSFVTPTTQSGVVAADFNGDAVVDLVTTDNVSGTFSLWLGGDAGGGVWDGTFTEVPVATPAGPGFPVVADFDEQNGPDVIVAGRIDKVLTLYLNDGSGGLSPGPAITTAGVGTPARLRAADLNLDGHVDLLVSNWSVNWSVYLGDGQGGFARQDYDNAIVEEFAVDDIDRDGIPDVVLVDMATDTDNYYVMQGQADAAGLPTGTFVELVRDPVGSNLAAIGVMDLNRDGLRDLVAASYVVLGREPTVAGDRVAFAPRFFGPTVTNPSAPPLDLNGDGFADLMGPRGTDGWLINLRHVTEPSGAPFGGRVEVVTAVSGAQVHTADFNADGAPDVLLSMPAFTGASLWFGVSDGLGLGTGQLVAGPALSSATGHATALGDFNGDGVTDVAMTSYYSKPISVLFGQSTAAGVPNATFVATDVGDADIFTRDLVTADLNGDGARDLVAVNVATGSHVFSLLGDVVGGVPTGTFAPATDRLLGAYASGLTVVDLNGDGCDDLIPTPSTSSSFEVLLSNCDATYQAAVSYTAPALVRAFATADLNADGTPDVIVMHDGPGLSIFMANGDGTLQTSSIDTSVPVVLRDILARDVNHDGVADLVAVSTEENSTRTYIAGTSEGVWDGTWQAPIVLPDAGGVTLAASDLNGDGMDDLLVSGTNGAGENVLRIIFGQYENSLALRYRVGRATASDVPPVLGVNLIGDDEPLAADNFGHLRRDDDVALFLEARSNWQPPSPLGAVPLTRAYTVSGDVRFKQEPTAVGRRLRMMPRFGPLTGASSYADDREGLDLTLAVPRGLVIELPVIRFHAGMAGSVIVRRVRRGMRSAAAVADDPLYADAEAARWVACAADGLGGCASSLFLPDVVVDELAEDVDGDLTTGSGARYVVAPPGTDRRTVRILTDEGGTYQAFLVP